MFPDKKIAIVCDWLVTYAGAERVLEQIIRIFPHADIFCVVDFLSDEQRFFLNGKEPVTTLVQKLPGARKHYRTYLPLMPIAVEQLDVSGYDIVISSSHAVAKGIITGPDQIHISYVHTPIRYAWDLQHQYLREAGLEHGLKSVLTRLLLHYIRIWDCRTSNGVNSFLANSKFVARRIKKVYGREATVIYPPVDTEKFTFCDQKENYYLTASRMVPYKKISLIVEAFNKMPDKKLVVIGDGPEFPKIKEMAKANIELLGWQPEEVLLPKMQHAKAFVFAAEEDFGITPVEAQACGTPVIAYGKGGATETIKGLDEEHPTGILFPGQTAEEIVRAVDVFEKNRSRFSYIDCRENAKRFSIKQFDHAFCDFVRRKIEAE